MDETSPLLGDIKARCEKELNIVDFDANGDPENPLEWPDVYKWTIVALLACLAFVT